MYDKREEQVRLVIYVFFFYLAINHKSFFLIVLMVRAQQMNG